MNQRRTFLQSLVALFGLGVTAQADCLGGICSSAKQHWPANHEKGFRLLGSRSFNSNDYTNEIYLYYSEIEQLSKTVVIKDAKSWRQTNIVYTNLEGLKHRNNQPAEIYQYIIKKEYVGDWSINEYYDHWYQNGLFHRDGDNPAIIGHCVSDHYTYGLPKKRGPSGWASSFFDCFEADKDGFVSMPCSCGDTFDQPYQHWFANGYHIKSEVWMGSCDYTEDLKPIICRRSLRMVEPSWFEMV